MKIVVSAIALRSGGTLAVLQDCLDELSKEKYSEWSIVAIVCNTNLVRVKSGNIKLIEIDGSRSYFTRLYNEYFYFKKLSKQIKPQVWLSLHDITPSVEAPCRIVYCHNSSPFYRFSFRDFRMDPVFGAFTLFYQYLYRINIRKNRFVVVQQQWLREKFATVFGVDRRKILVAHPHIDYPSLQNMPSEKITFFYPSLPRVFKNNEVICEAVRILNAGGKKGFEVVLTLDGSENKYAASIRSRFSDVDNIVFAGLQPREKVFEWYGSASCLVFPSLLESWGLPISEFRQTGKPIILADLEYAHETLGAYEKALFFDPHDAVDLAMKMEAVLDGTANYVRTNPKEIPEPMTGSWDEFFQIVSRSIQ